ncbi:hypothetical protein LTR86_010709 [Recurvomyces mirabilis]|nr:hypothetical protein LTR86_010709 [Recurvomyces mirabilis]
MSPTSSSKKREREDDSVDAVAGGNSTNNFRNVSACHRCRNRKNRCDQQLPRCSNCEKANVKCVGFDPVSKRAIPRNYVYYLESRVENLEALLRANGIQCPPPSDDFPIDGSVKPGVNVPYPPQEDTGKLANDSNEDDTKVDPALQDHNDFQKLDKVVNNVGLVSVQGPADHRRSSHTSGIPFSRVVYAAVKSSVTPTPSERAATRSTKQLPSSTASGGGGSDSFFGLNTKPTVKAAPFPEKHIGLRLVELYFEHANPQIPVLHRGEFNILVERVYAAEPKRRRPRELYLLNIVFAIGAGIIMGHTDTEHASAPADSSKDDQNALPNRKRQRVASQQHQPEEYHSAAIVHLDSFLGSSPAAEGASAGLEELQAVLLLAGLALLRPVAPGLWYIIGVAVRLAVDLGLHIEDLESELDTQPAASEDESFTLLGRRQWVRDFRRRLWWCTYSFDRLVSTCVGRPFGVSDQVVTTEFPSLLDDKFIKPNGFLRPSNELELPTYKLVAHHYFRLRLLQSEILQVLQYRQSQQTRALGVNSGNQYMHTALPSPFLSRYRSFRDWRLDIDRRLLDWKETAPEQSVTGVKFTPLFLELNYWQAVIMLYRQSLTVPEPLAGELSPSTGGEVQSPGAASLESDEDEEVVFMKVAQAGQTVLKIYRQLHRLKLVNYTFLATHHLFMSGISFLYAIWHSVTVRSQLTLDDVDFTILIATSVLTDLIDKCPPAEACRDAFTRMSKATISMVMSTTGFGNASTLGSQPLNSPGGYIRTSDLAPHVMSTKTARHQPHRAKPPMPQFDMDLKSLFSDDELANHASVYRPNMPAFDGSAFNLAPEQQMSPLLPTAPMAPPELRTDTSSYTSATPDSSTGASQYSMQPSRQSLTLPFQITNQQPYHGLAETITQSQPEYSFDDLSFLDSFPVTDPSGIWHPPTDFDLGFGTGGTGQESNGMWDANGPPDLFDGFFFG